MPIHSFIHSFINLFADLCYTPESIAGDCRSIYDCPSVLAQFQGRLTRRTTNYLRSLQCESGSGQYPHVCCALFNNFQQPDQSYPSSKWQSNRPNNYGGSGSTIAGRRGNGQILPGTGTCGLTSLSQRIYGGDDTQLDDYPWIALLQYQKRKCSQSSHAHFHSHLLRNGRRRKCDYIQFRAKKNCIHSKW